MSNESEQRHEDKGRPARHEGIRRVAKDQWPGLMAAVVALGGLLGSINVSLKQDANAAETLKHREERAKKVDDQLKEISDKVDTKLETLSNKLETRFGAMEHRFVSVESAMEEVKRDTAILKNQATGDRLRDLEKLTTTHEEQLKELRRIIEILEQGKK